MPPQYRGTSHLAFLQNIPWLAVFDLFDGASKQDGLHYVYNETTDSPRAKLRSLDDFKNVSSDWITDQDFNLPTRGTTWITSNEEMQKGEWIKCSRDCFYRALSAYKLCCPPGRLLCVFLGLDENSVQEMVDMMECSFSILGSFASSCVTLISENKHVTETFIKASKLQLQRELRGCSITGIQWRLLKEIVRELVGPIRFEERDATTELPYFSGKFKEVLNKMIHSWDDLEVYSPNPRLPSSVEEIENERNAFYKGGQASQTNLFHNHSIQRTLEDRINTKIEQALDGLSNPTKDLTCHAETVTVPYEPGSGATTLCRRILWNKRNNFRCAIVKAITNATDYQIEKLQRIVYDEENVQFAPPCLILVDNFPENEMRRLTEKIMKRQIKCVILSTFPIAKLSTISDLDMTPLRQLDEKEMDRVKDVLINITSDSRRRRDAEEVLEREKRFIWFGLELFGRDYDKIEERLQNHIQSTFDFLDGSQEIHEIVLNFCCFLHFYSDGRAILPHSFASDFLYEASEKNEEDIALMEHIHQIFGGLLLEVFDETNGYYGWRPAHALVSEVVMSRINTEETAICLLERIYQGKAYVNKFLREQVLKVFLDRKRISDPVLMEDQGKDAGSIDSDFENDVFGFYEVKTRYSPFIVDILKDDNGIQRALRLLITICQKASEIEEKSYAWQQLARFMGYEMGTNEMDEKNEQHRRLLTTMNREQDGKLPMPKTGIEAAHIAVDIAINQQPNYSHHYVTKGNLYLLQLRNLKPEERPNLACESMPEVIRKCRKALECYDKALSTTHALNHYSMIGKIQAIVSLLEIVKGLPFFRLQPESFTRYLKETEIPREMESALTREEYKYVQSLSRTTLGLLNELFGDVKLRQVTTYDNKVKEVRSLSNAKIRASKLRRSFYEVSGFDRSEMSNVEVPMPSSPLPRDAPVLYQQFVQDILFQHDETPYSSWASLSDGEVSRIYRLLNVLCLRGYGSREDMLICGKACLRLKERPSVEELGEIVRKWVEKYPNSEWAHLFNYMIHFPIPNRSLAAFSHSAKESIKKCNRIVRDKTGIGFRKSGAEYFLGKGIGLYAIVSMQSLHQEFPSLETKWETKTHFWRSNEISEKLERVCGQKDVNFNGVITYQGIQLRFDNTRYPNQSKDDLWFYVGFSVSGPYAYDPVDNDTYAIVKHQTRRSVLSDFPPFAAANIKDNLGASVSRRGKVRQLKNGSTSGSQMSEETHVKAEHLEEFRDNAAPSTKQPRSSSTPQFLHRLPSGKQMVEYSVVSSSSASIPFMSGISSWGSIDSLHQQAASSNRVQSYASALQLGNQRQEEQMAKTASAQTGAPSIYPKGCKWKHVEGSHGQQRKFFQPKYVDKMGKLHHGAWVLGAEKSKECMIHTSQACDISTIARCTFAHSWRGDTLQYVCKKCTRENKEICREKRNHERYIWNLGPYYSGEGVIWEDMEKEHPI